MKDITRREFLETSAKATAATVLGAGVLESILNPQEAIAAGSGNTNKSGVAEQVLSLPKGGGAIKGLGEKFQPDLHSGTGNFSIPLQVPPGRNGFQPDLSLSYSTGAGNGPFGMGWGIGIPSVSRQTSKGIPRYDDAEDTFVLSGAEDLVPVNGKERLYRPRTEGLFARIRKIKSPKDGEDCWEVTSKNGLRSYYGLDDDSRVFVVENGRKKVFQWLISETADPCGNKMVYRFQRDQKPDSFPNADIKRTEQNHDYNQVYLQEIAYMNFREADDSEDQYFIRIQFDYGQFNGDGSEKPGAGTSQWEFRPDRFSGHRAGFEIRTARRCKRILMKVRDEAQRGLYHLVKTYQLDYKPFDPEKDFSNISLLTAVRLHGYRDEKTRAFPPLTFGYTEFWPEYRTFENFEAPTGYLPDRPLSDPNYELIDLTGNGLPDVIHTGRDGFRFWKNVGNGRFIGPKTMRKVPTGARLEHPGVQFADMEGNGRADLLITGGVSAGYFETTYSEEEEWEHFHPYPHAPEFSFEDPEVRLVDLDGDGVTDVLKTGRQAFLYYRNQGRQGFADPEVLSRQQNKDEFPDIYFSNPWVHLADMSGDGLQDIVVIQDQRIEYWPNLGHGRWGKRILMTDAPELNGPYEPNGTYDPRRLFFSDVDGDGLADLIYVAHDCVKVWLNQSGNGWSKNPKIIRGTPSPIPNSVRLADMKGSGCAGVLWTFEPAQQQGSHYKYLDFTGGIKPHLLSMIDNNLGASTVVEYRPSTDYWRDDYQKEEPWLTHLPFPVQVVAKVEVIDHIAKAKLTTTFAYHHGYYDGREREFRGFGRTDQLDTEIFDTYRRDFLHDQKYLSRLAQKTVDNNLQKTLNQISYLPPVLSKTWFHPGIYIDEKQYLEKIRREYYRGDRKAFQAHFQVETADAPFEAFRALRGAILRTETYGLDGTAVEQHPYVVTENGYRVTAKQPRGSNKHEIFFLTNLESFTYHYERNPQDPRISQTIVHKIDDFGNVTDSLTIAYPRRSASEHTEQKSAHIIYSKQNFINQDSPRFPYFIGYLSESKQIELLLPEGKEVERLLPENVASLDLDSERHHLFSQVRNYYDGPAYQGLPIGQIGQCGLLTRTETLALQKEQWHIFLNKLPLQELTTVLTAAGYVASNGDWWVQTQRTRYDPSQYYLPINQLDPRGNESALFYDRFSLLIEKTVDPIGNEATVEKNDYRALSPSIIRDMNDNLSGVVFDELGLVIRTAVMGKEGENLGDTLNSDLEATTYIRYNPDAYINAGQPVWSEVYAREEHLHNNPDPRWKRTRTYADGLGREIQTKTPAVPGMVAESHCDPRMVASGWKVYNNKGWVVEQYEPFFSCTWDYEAEVLHGVSAKMAYDPLGRVLRTDYPDGTFSRVEFTPWQQVTFDANDTVQQSKWYRAMSRGTSLQQDAAQKALKHDQTPITVHLDSLGRTFLTVEDNGESGKYSTLSVYDIQGNVVSMKDPRSMNKHEEDRYNAFEHQYDLRGNILHRWQMDSGERFILLDAQSNPVKTWDSRGHLVEHEYDPLNRLTHVWVTPQSPGEQPAKRLAEKIVYGEFSEIAENPQQQKQTGKAKNLRGQVYRQCDGAGRSTLTEYDFKGNLIQKTQEVLNPENLEDEVNWQADNQRFLNDIPGNSAFVYDALNRTLSSTAPDNSKTIREYDEGGLQKSILLKHYTLNESTPIVKNITYNARGQREKIEYGNQVVTEYRYDPNNFRLMELKSASPQTVFQHYRYTYDPVGNITFIQNLSARTICHDSTPVNGNKDYTYDALYRLIQASGRELRSNTAYNQHEDPPFVQCRNHPNDQQALRPYQQEYSYDPAGNILLVNHIAEGGSWQRHYHYDRESNRLQKTELDSMRTLEYQYTFDAHGNHTSFPHLANIQWDFKDQMQIADMKGGGKAYYWYDASGMRVRKVVVNTSGAKQKETVYLGDYEISLKYGEGTVQEKIETAHLMDDRQRAALAETRLVHEGSPQTPRLKMRYQVADHLGSSTWECGEDGIPITCEEYFPYGGTAYHETNHSGEYSAKRYRYSGKEKDEETGFYYYGVRYFISWLARWLNCDPMINQYIQNNNADLLHLYEFNKDNPLKNIDLWGYNSEDFNQFKDDFIEEYIKEENFVQRAFFNRGLEKKELVVDETLVRNFVNNPQISKILKFLYDEQSYLKKKMPMNLNQETIDDTIKMYEDYVNNSEYYYFIKDGVKKSPSTNLHFENWSDYNKDTLGLLLRLRQIYRSHERGNWKYAWFNFLIRIPDKGMFEQGLLATLPYIKHWLFSNRYKSFYYENKQLFIITRNLP